MDLSKLQPDLVLSVLYANDGGVPTAAAKKDLAQVVTALTAAGLRLVVRPGLAATLLVFVRANPETLAAATAASHANDVAAGRVPPSAPPAVDSLSPADRIRLVMQLAGAGVGACPGARLAALPAVLLVLPLQDRTANWALLKQWARALWFETTPEQIAHLHAEYGSAVGFLFAFSAHFVAWVVPLAAVGLVLHVVFLRFSAVYAFVTTVWSALFIHSWKRKERELAVSWGLLHVEEDARVNSWTAVLKRYSFIPLGAAVAAVIVAYQLLCFATEILLTQIYVGPLASALALVPTVMIVVFIPVVQIVYDMVVERLVAWEAHATPQAARASRLEKQFVIFFLSSYVPLLLSAFVYLPFAHLVGPYVAPIRNTIAAYGGGRLGISTVDEFAVNAARLTTQYQYYSVQNSVVGIATEYLVPAVLARVAVSKPKLPSGEEVVFNDVASEQEYLAEVRSQVALRTYDVAEDLTKLVGFFGYFVMFGPVWSASVVLFAVFAVIRVKLSVVKVMTQVRRVDPSTRVSSIAPFDGYLVVLAWVGAITAPLISALYRRGHDTLVSPYSWKLAVLVFASEHVWVVLNGVCGEAYARYVSVEELRQVQKEFQLRREWGVKAGAASVSSELVLVDSAWCRYSPEETLRVAESIPMHVVRSSVRGKTGKVDKADKADKADKPSGSTTAMVQPGDLVKIRKNLRYGSEKEYVVETMDDSKHADADVSNGLDDSVAEIETGVAVRARRSVNGGEVHLKEVGREVSETKSVSVGAAVPVSVSAPVSASVPAPAPASAPERPLLALVLESLPVNPQERPLLELIPDVSPPSNRVSVAASDTASVKSRSKLKGLFKKRK